jgi:hypothetical protein
VLFRSRRWTHRESTCTAEKAEDVMKIRVVAVAVAVASACLVLFVATVGISLPLGDFGNTILAILSGVVSTGEAPAAPDPKTKISQQPSTLPADVAALSGIWEGIGPDALPTRLVVKDIHENWATVLYTWGDHPDGKFQQGWLKVRAKVLPGGKLFWRQPGGFSFQLSEDRTTLVGKRERSGVSAVSLLHRVPSHAPLNLMSPGEGG